MPRSDLLRQAFLEDLVDEEDVREHRPHGVRGVQVVDEPGADGGLGEGEADCRQAPSRSGPSASNSHSVFPFTPDVLLTMFPVAHRLPNRLPKSALSTFFVFPNDSVVLAW